MKKVLALALVVCLTAMSGMLFAEGQAAYPERDITNVLVWGAGGGTDTCNRVVMAEMAKEFLNCLRVQSPKINLRLLLIISEMFPV